MTPEILGLVLIGVMLFAIFVGFPISFTLIFLGMVFGYLGFGPLVFYLMTYQFYSVMMEQTLAAVPLFVFMGIMMEKAGLMERLFEAVQLMLSRVRGSLYLAVLFVSTIFAAATGIVGASVTILGIMAAKTMNRSGYDVRLAAGTITAGGTLGILIPPSIMLVVMGPVLEVPVTDLFAAAIVPGIMLAVLYAVYALVRCWMNPALGPGGRVPRIENPVDGHGVPVPHCGVVMTFPQWQVLAERLSGVIDHFLIEPHIRFKGRPGEQGTMFFLDPSGNALEFKAFRDIERELFAH